MDIRKARRCVVIPARAGRERATLMAAPPESTKPSPQQRLSGRARERWPQRAGVEVKFRGGFAYLAGRLPNKETLPLMRLRYGGYGGYAASW